MKIKDFTQHLVSNEIRFALEMLEAQDLRNEAAWVYLKGLLAQTKEEQARSLATNVKKWFILDFPELKQKCIELLEKDEVNKANRFIYSVLVDFETAEGNHQASLDHLQRLKKIDRLRENYY